MMNTAYEMNDKDMELVNGGSSKYKKSEVVVDSKTQEQVYRDGNSTPKTVTVVHWKIVKK